MLRADKEKKVCELAEKIQGSPSLFLTDFTGLNVEEISELRKNFREKQVKYQIAKNTLIRLAARKAEREEILNYLEGPTGLAFGGDDPSLPARILHDFVKKLEKPKVKAFLVEGKLFEGKDLKRFASLPSREILLAEIVAGVNSPIANLIFTLSGILGEFVGVIDALARARSELK